MSGPGSEPRERLAERVAARIEERADALVEEWIDWLRSRVGTRTINSLPRSAIRDHIPPVLRSLARYVANPVGTLRHEMMWHLRVHARLRRDQGYDVQELLAEFDGLGHLVSRTVMEALAEQDDAAALVDGVAVYERVSAGLRALAFVTVGVYRETETRQRRDLAERLEEFGRAIAHELRSPLNTAFLGTELLADDRAIGDETRRADILRLIRKALERTQGLLDDIRLLALAEGSQSERRIGRVADTLRQVRDEIAPSARRNGVEVRIPAELPDVSVETTPFAIALVNLIGNAVKYHDPEKEPPSVEVELEVQGDATGSIVLCTVRDNGLGIPKEVQGQVFQRNFRAHPDIAEGTGLGLAITRQILQERGGSIEMRSTPGEGTSVTFDLPAVDPADERQGEATRDREDTPDALMERSIEETRHAEAELDED